MSKQPKKDTKNYENVNTNIEYNRRNDPELDPFEIEFLPQFQQDRGPKKPFVNEHGVLIGDHDYESEQSPLNHWSTDTDPAIMSGDDWVHPYKDVGFHAPENKDYFENGVFAPLPGKQFMHPDKDVAYQAYLPEDEDENKKE